MMNRRQVVFHSSFITPHLSFNLSCPSCELFASQRVCFGGGLFFLLDVQLSDPTVFRERESHEQQVFAERGLVTKRTGLV